ncbi:MAG: LytTR family transcriptional regulator [Bacteroidales bacterium]|nr:LytTR family transcriptional regulator [Candidatus Colimorpha onthohippi]
MTKIPKQIYSIRNTVYFVLGTALFVMAFAVFYHPIYNYDDSALSQWNAHADFCTTILTAIILATIAASRTLLLILTRTSRLSEMEYLLWQMAEVVSITLFSDLFISLYYHTEYFALLPTILLIETSVLIYPYSIYWLLIERIERDYRIAEAQQTIVSLRQGKNPNETDIIQFADEKGAIRLMVSASKVYIIESAGNYVTVVYEEDGNIMRYALRNSMKGVESVCEMHNLVRCHRSYYINIQKVQLISKASCGATAKMMIDAIPEIPISKNYLTTVADLFSTRLQNE